MTQNAMTITTQAAALYAKVDNPIQAMMEIGKLIASAGMIGINTPGDGFIVASACMSEGLSFFDFAKTYHIISGRPSMKADAMAARFRQAGGKITIIDDGDDCKKASAKFSYDGQEYTCTYTIEEARLAMGKDEKTKLDRIDIPNSNWVKFRGAMLWSRLNTKAIRRVAPELIAGVYTPEELEDSQAVSTPAPAKDRASRKKELEAESSSATTTNVIVESHETTNAVVQPATDVIIDVEPESPPFATDAASVADDSDLPTTNELLQELVLLGKKMPSQTNPGSPMDLAEVAAGICKAAKVEKPQLATRGQIRKLITAFRKALGEK